MKNIETLGYLQFEQPRHHTSENEGRKWQSRIEGKRISKGETVQMGGFHVLVGASEEMRFQFLQKRPQYVFGRFPHVPVPVTGKLNAISVPERHCISLFHGSNSLTKDGDEQA